MESSQSRRYDWIVVLFAAASYITGIISPPSLMDDVDASQALMARNMLTSGDWVTARLDGVVFFDKAPLKYWVTVLLYRMLGAHDWVARIPPALSAILLCWMVLRFGRWAFSQKAGFYAGLFLSTCIGLFLFTRIVIPDVTLTLSVALAIWAFLRTQDDEEKHHRLWAYVLAVSVASGVLLKGLIGLVFPCGAIFVYLVVTRTLFNGTMWRRLYPLTSSLIFLAVAAPWHILATLRNPPYFDFTLRAGPGEYHGFFWFYFINEQLLRFLNLRYPRDYNTVPRLYFWLLNLVWLFPWSVYVPQLFRLSYRPVDRAGRTRLMALCWIGFIMVFFTFSTTQEYYSMPIYPALALLLGCGVAARERSIRSGARLVAVMAGLAVVVIVGILLYVRGVPTPGDISMALSQKPGAYTLSLGHMQDLTLRSFAYLRLPLAIAGVAFAVGAIGGWALRGQGALLALATMMLLLFQATRLALVVFDPFLSSRPIAEVLKRAPAGTLITFGDHNRVSSLFFYSEDKALLLDGRVDTMEYGSYAPDAAPVFITDDDFKRLWLEPRLYYLAIKDKDLNYIRGLIGGEHLHLVASIGGKWLFSNEEIRVNSPARL